MSFSRVYSAQTNLLKGAIITIEIDITPKTLHSFNLIGLPDKAVEESKDRVSSAIKNSGFVSPKSKNQKIIVSLSPSDLKKEGSYFDLAISLSYLLAKDELKFNPEKKIFLGELSLNGELKPIHGALPLVQEIKRRGFEEVYLPKQNAKEAALVSGVKIFPVSTLKEAINHLDERKAVGGKEKPKITVQPPTEIKINEPKNYDLNFQDIRGQEFAKRGLEIAAAGKHNILMYGPPGTGKTMLAKAFAGILPELELEDIFEITGIHSISGTLKNDLVTAPPFRSPHHTSSYVSIIGGGTFPKPGEVTMAHGGVLFLDEFPELDKRVVEAMRQPLEDGVVSISRAKGSATFPSRFILVAAMNPCPCGYNDSKKRPCVCRPVDLEKYKRKLSGPILDRIDLLVGVGDIDYQKLSDNKPSGDSTASIHQRVKKARDIQSKRFKNHSRKIKTNSEMNVKDLTSLIKLSPEIKDMLNQSAARMSLSARAYHRVIKLARTIADLAQSEDIKKEHLLEALQYRTRAN